MPNKNTKAKKIEVRVVVFSEEQWTTDDWPSNNLQDAITWFTSKLSEVPEEYRHKATLEIKAQTDYDYSAVMYIEIAYYRPETDEEYNRRMTTEAEAALRTRAAELAQLAALRAKYNC